MNQAVSKAETVELDVSDVARRVGEAVGGGLKMTNQDGGVLATGKVDVELPL